MALNLKPGAISLEAAIQRAAKSIYLDLNAVWNLTAEDKKLEGFGRCFFLNRDGKKTIEKFKQNRDYGPLTTADKSKFFFVARKPKRPDGIGRMRTSIELFFILNLNVIKPGTEYRYDNEAESDILEAITGLDNIWLEAVENDYDAVMSEFSEFMVDKTMQPWFVAKLTLGVSYRVDERCCCD
jgi:hypothetical protein